MRKACTGTGTHTTLASPNLNQSESLCGPSKRRRTHRTGGQLADPGVGAGVEDAALVGFGASLTTPEGRHAEAPVVGTVPLGLEAAAVEGIIAVGLGRIAGVREPIAASGGRVRSVAGGFAGRTGAIQSELAAGPEGLGEVEA